MSGYVHRRFTRKQNKAREVRVAAGMAYMDEVRPGWRPKISIPDLDLLYGDRCILGQVDGEYWGAKKALGLSDGKAISLGLTERSIPESRRETEYGEKTQAAKREDERFAALTREWVRQLSLRNVRS